MAAEKHTSDFGARLREARERRGVSLRAIADATKISVRALEALERSDISRLPGGIFSRAFVRAYASEVGLDPEQAVADFITRFPDETVTQGHPRTRTIVDELDDDGRSSRMPLLGRLMIVVGLVALAIAIYYGVLGRRTSSGPEPVSPPAAAAPRPSAHGQPGSILPASGNARRLLALR